MRRTVVKKKGWESKILLSILIPTLHTRMENFNQLVKKLLHQIEVNDCQKEVEIISHFDTKSIPLVEKRNDMQRRSTGLYLTHLDDDDDISENYLEEILKVIKLTDTPDVITFNQYCDIEETKFEVRCDLNFDLELFQISPGVFKRYPWQWCVWKSAKTKDIFRSGKTYGEDTAWLLQVKEKIKSFYNIDKILHYYKFRKDKTEC